MKRITRFLFTFGAIILMSPMALAQDEYQLSFANYTVHYNAFPSEFLEPQVSKTVGIKRSASRGVLAIAVKEKLGNTSRSVKADINGTATNLIGQIRKLDMIEVKDGDVVYYLGQFTVAHDEMLRFNIGVLPAGDNVRKQFTFSHQF